MGGRPAKLNEIKGDRDLEREIKNKVDIYASLPACLLYPYYKENLWLNSGVISRAMFARALKEIRDNDVFG